MIKALLPSQLHWLLRASGLLHADAAPPSAAWCLALVSAGALIPLSSLSSMEQIKYASVASVVLVYIFVLCVCAAGYLRVTSDEMAMREWTDDQHWWRGNPSDWLRAFPIVSFSFLCHSTHRAGSNPTLCTPRAY